MKTRTTSLALSFALPFTIMGAAFALHGVFPFGSRQMLVGDLYDQFFPFLSGFWHQIREGSLAPWSWIAGGGHDYAAIFAYCLASPLNLLAVLAPYSWLREMVTFLLLVKLGCAGLFTGIFLHSAFHREDGHSQQEGPAWTLALPVFSTLYALCAYTLGYYYSIQSFDSFALLPLVMLGLLALMREGKFRLYIISLALAVGTNFLIGFYICIFAAIMFAGQCIIQKVNKRDFLHKLGLFASCSLLAVGMTAVFLVPSWSAIQSTSLQEVAFTFKAALINNFFDVLGNFIAFQPPTTIYGLPNLYSGMITVMLAGLFICCPKISRRERIVISGIVFFLVISCNINVLEYMWNGFNNFRGLPSRYSFLLSFMLVTMAYRAFVSAEKISHKWLLIMGISAVLVLLAAVFGSQERTAIVGSTVLCGVYMLLLLFKGKGTGRVQRFTTMAFFLVIIAEITISSWIGVRTNSTHNRDDYPNCYEEIQALLNLRRSDEDNFYRTDINLAQTLNDPFLHYYNGISFYSSTANANVVKFMFEHGLSGWDRNFYYNETTPLLNAFLSMRYLISLRDPQIESSVYWETIGRAADVFLFENRYYLPLGFMVKDDLANYAHLNKTPFLSQNSLFSRATGLDGRLFTVTNITNNIPRRTQDNDGNRILIWNYTMPSDDLLYFYSEYSNSMLLGVHVNDNFFGYILLPDLKISSYVSIVGSFARGDIISFFSAEGVDITMHVGCFDSDLFERGYAQLASQPLVLTEFTETKVSGHVTALEDGLLYTSIPTDKNWSVYVDGVKKDIVLVDNAMTAVRLSEGAHKVEFRYFNRSLLAGIIISLFSFALFIVLILIKRNRRN